MRFEDVIVETDRLLLRAYRIEDVDGLAPMFADPEHMRYYPAPLTREGTVAWVERQLERYREDGFGLWIIEERSTKVVLGTAGPTLQVVEGDPHVEIGWHVRPGRKGEGIAPEAGAAARDWAFANLGVDHVISLVRPENVPSARVAEKLGMQVDREADFKGLLHRVWWLDAVAREEPKS
ncbi:MAG: GNAT family N-acetyltransferase [Actinomycetota bacterium]